MSQKVFCWFVLNLKDFTFFCTVIFLKEFLRYIFRSHVLFTMLCCFFSVDLPNITYISGNQTVNQTDSVTLSCLADGNPAPRITWTRVSDNSAVTFPLTITGKGDEGAYSCTADNDVKDSFSKDTFIIVQSKSKAFWIGDKKVVFIMITIFLRILSRDAFQLRFQRMRKKVL